MLVLVEEGTSIVEHLQRHGFEAIGVCEAEIRFDDQRGERGSAC